MANVNEMAADIKAEMVALHGEDLVNEVESLGIGSCKLSYDNISVMDASVFFLGIRDAKNGVFDFLETGYNCEAFNDAYLAGWQAYITATDGKKRKFMVKNIE